MAGSVDCDNFASPRKPARVEIVPVALWQNNFPGFLAYKHGRYQKTGAEHVLIAHIFLECHGIGIISSIKFALCNRFLIIISRFKYHGTNRWNPFKMVSSESSVEIGQHAHAQFDDAANFSLHFRERPGFGIVRPAIQLDQRGKTDRLHAAQPFVRCSCRTNFRCVQNPGETAIDQRRNKPSMVIVVGINRKGIV